MLNLSARWRRDKTVELTKIVLNGNRKYRIYPPCDVKLCYSPQTWPVAAGQVVDLPIEGLNN